MTSRREFIQRSAGAVLASALPVRLLRRWPGPEREYVDLMRPPDGVIAETAGGVQRLRAAPGGGGRWVGSGVAVTLAGVSGPTRVELSAPAVGVTRMALRWNGRLDATRLLVGDAWERGYGDLEWRGFVPDRVMPWYVTTWGGDAHARLRRAHRRQAFCFWQVDPEGIWLWADVRSGGSTASARPARLDRLRHRVPRRAGRANRAFAAMHAFCRQMCAAPRLPSAPVYGSNDWYYAYGNNSAATVLADAEQSSSSRPRGTNRPFVVIDDGWQPGRGASSDGAGTWDRGNEKFPDLPGLAGRGARRGARARHRGSVRCRRPPTRPTAGASPRDRGVLDPTVAGVAREDRRRHRAAARMGIRMIKHDYSTYDIFGRWGDQMGSALTRDGWTFAEGPTRTTAEVIDELYRTIRDGGRRRARHWLQHREPSVGRACSTICRIGDDTSGTEWARTRKMGVNTLAFRGAQHGAFYAADADCVGVDERDSVGAQPAVARSASRGAGRCCSCRSRRTRSVRSRRRDLRAALAMAAEPQPLGEPLDWQRTTWPSRWRLMGAERSYDWGFAAGQ